jgi:hypothetical protein
MNCHAAFLASATLLNILPAPGQPGIEVKATTLFECRAEDRTIAFLV